MERPSLETLERIKKAGGGLRVLGAVWCLAVLVWHCNQGAAVGAGLGVVLLQVLVRLQFGCSRCCGAAVAGCACLAVESGCCSF